jgi:hypothetical protein
MTVARLQFPFVMRKPALGAASLVPMLPLTLATTKNVAVSGLLDTGATVNVLPYASGVALGFDWDRQTTSVQLGGNFAAVEARAVTVSAIVGNLAPVRLVFAWTQADDVPLLLGQVNFFAEFDVCIFRSRGIFDIRPAQRP